MTDQSFFKEALSDFAFDVAYGDSIRHLHESGMTPEDIKNYLNTTLSVEKIKEVINKHESKITSSNNNYKQRYEYVKEYDEYGKSSFIKKRID